MNNNILVMKNIKIIQELHDLGITGYHEVVYNPTYEELFKAEMSAKIKVLKRSSYGIRRSCCKNGYFHR